MNKMNISELFIYKYRYIIGYTLVSLGLIATLLFAGFYSPGGITEKEMASVVNSNNLNLTNFDPAYTINLPYHALQRLSIKIFGVTNFSIKLASIILAFLSALGMIILLRKWVRPNVGILASLIAVTTGQFLFIAQSGTPDILYLLWSAWLLLIALLIANKQKLRKTLIMVFFVIMSLSLYTPLSIYVLIAFIGALVLHPHLRFLVRQTSKLELAIGLAVTIIILLPLFIAITQNPKILLTLLGLPNSWPNWLSNLNILGAEYFGFANAGKSALMTPFFELGSMLIILAGLYYTIKKRSDAKSYIIISWVVCLIPILIINPELTSITFLPLVILLASGLKLLLNNWYGIFPSNPYARIVGLIPLTMLVGVLVYSGADRYIYGYRYDPSIVSNFSSDLDLLPKNSDLVVSKKEIDFYKVVQSHNKNLTTQLSPEPNMQKFIATRNANRPFDGYKIEKIIVSPDSNDADRFYLYQKIKK